MKALFSKKSDHLLAPIYYLQAKRVAKTALRLPEPMGVRHYQADGSPTIAILGDSAAAGVGVHHQDHAPLGRIIHHLSTDNVRTSHQLHATSGHASFDLLTRLYAMPSAIDWISPSSALALMMSSKPRAIPLGKTIFATSLTC